MTFEEQQERVIRKQANMKAISDHIARSHLDAYRNRPGIDKEQLLTLVSEVERAASKELFSIYPEEQEEGVRLTVERYKWLVNHMPDTTPERI